jgi:predicted Zn-dependent protease
MNVRYAMGHLAVGTLLLVAVTGFTHKTILTPAITGKLPVTLSPVTLPPNVIDRLGAWIFQLQLQNAEISSDPVSTTLVDRVSKRLIEAAKGTEYAEAAKQFQWDFRVLKNDQKIKAFALPGGKIAVYTGLFQVTKGDEDLLAVVLGHEIIHALARHGAERINAELHRELILAATGVGLAQQGLSPKATAGVIVAMGLSHEGAVMRPFSRQHEFEADDGGLLLMARAGYNPQKAISFWEEMKQRRGKQTPEFLSAHPSDTARIDQLKKQLPVALQYYEPRS